MFFVCYLYILVVCLVVGGILCFIVGLLFVYLGMKVYDIKEKEVIFEFFFKFVGNLNIIVVVKVFGMKVIV